jgi:catechol 2,3-dioxygenase-like lactoylglutathione lyase family enzyme
VKNEVHIHWHSRQRLETLHRILHENNGYERGDQRKNASRRYLCGVESRGSEQQLELNYYPPGNRFCEEYVEGSELDHLAFLCDDVREGYEKALAGGATSAVEPWDERGCTLALVRDPDGVWIELHGKTTKPVSRKRNKK